MVVGELADSCDVLVIGAGPGGYVAALRLARAGKRVTLVERDFIGGTCLNIGCIPSKVLIHAAELAHLPKTSAGTGVGLRAEVDAAAIQSHIGEVVSELTRGVEGLLAGAGVTVVSGTARFSRPRRVAISTGESVSHLEFEHCIIATGSRPVELANLPFDETRTDELPRDPVSGTLPDRVGAAETNIVDLSGDRDPNFHPDESVKSGIRVVDSSGALALSTVPEQVVVVGGGYIGLELGTAWVKLGSSVTIVEVAERLLPEMDKGLASVVARRLRQLNVTVLTGTKATGRADGGVEVTSAGGATTLPADIVLVAVGRTPNTDDLGLDHAGVPTDSRGLIVVGPDRRATRHILAIGDVTAGPALAHKATAEAEVAARAILGESAAFDPAAIPAVVFSDPELASVGLTVADAAQTGQQVTQFRFPFGAGSRSRTLGDTAGFVQVVADSQGTVVGVHMAGAGVSELAAAAALAIELGATVEEVAATIHPHPTMSEAFAEAAHGALGFPLHITR